MRGRSGPDCDESREHQLPGISGVGAVHCGYAERNGGGADEAGAGLESVIRELRELREFENLADRGRAVGS